MVLLPVCGNYPIQFRSSIYYHPLTAAIRIIREHLCSVPLIPVHTALHSPFSHPCFVTLNQCISLMGEIPVLQSRIRHSAAMLMLILSNSYWGHFTPVNLPATAVIRRLEVLWGSGVHIWLTIPNAPLAGFIGGGFTGFPVNPSHLWVREREYQLNWECSPCLSEALGSHRIGTALKCCSSCQPISS